MILLALMVAVSQSGSFTHHTYASDVGTRDYWLYVPASYDSSKAVPLMVMLHGCTQDAADIARGSRLNERADAQGFIVVYPEQPASANPLKCWNWFDAKQQTRTAGEPALIAGITEEVLRKYHIDRKRVFLAGISAGAAMGNIVAVTHPELFAALGLHAGLEYQAATRVQDARNAMNVGGPDPVGQGELAFRVMGDNAKLIPVFMANGGRDQSVPPLHVEQLTKQWLSTAARLGLKAGAPRVTTGQSDAGYHFTRTTITDAGGRALVESLIVEEMAHALSGGAATGTFTDPNGPDAIGEMLHFFFAVVN